MALGVPVARRYSRNVTVRGQNGYINTPSGVGPSLYCPLAAELAQSLQQG